MFFSGPIANRTAGLDESMSTAMARKKAERGLPLGPGWSYAAVSRLLNVLNLALGYAWVKRTREVYASADGVLQ
jgi:hypothetical protein